MFCKSIIKILSLFIPFSNWRKQFRKSCNKKISIIYAQIEIIKNNIFIKDNYRQVLKKLKNKVNSGQKIRVGFLVSERQKWNCDYLYDKLLKSNIFEPVILLTARMDQYSYEEFDKSYNFFKNLNLNVKLAFKDGEFLDLSIFNVDVLFYQQPWEIDKKQDIINTSKFALCMYIHYSVTNSIFCAKNNYKNFLKNLYVYFVINKEEKELLISIDKHINFVATGHPKLDVFINDNKKYEKKYIIYAPHHSFEDDGLKFATFQWNGKEILEFAKKHREFNWIFKPHPRFKFSVVSNGILTEEEKDKYFEEWAKIGKVCDDGNYFDLFKQSKCLITDCGSFLVEYLPTKSPVTFLVNKDSQDRNEVITKDVIKTYYNIHNLEELNNCFEEVLVRGNDYKKEKRLKCLEKYKDVFETDASLNIINYLKGVIHEK